MRVLIAEPDWLHVARNAAKKTFRDLPFAIWMALARAALLHSGDPMIQQGAVQDVLS